MTVPYLGRTLLKVAFLVVVIASPVGFLLGVPTAEAGSYTPGVGNNCHPDSSNKIGVEFNAELYWSGYTADAWGQSQSNLFEYSTKYQQYVQVSQVTWQTFYGPSGDTNAHNVFYPQDQILSTWWSTRGDYNASFANAFTQWGQAVYC